MRFPMYTGSNRGRIEVMFAPYYLHKFLKLYVSQTKGMSQLQKQPSEVFYWKSCSQKFRNIHGKTPALWSIFNRVAGAGLTCNCIKRDFNDRCWHNTVSLHWNALLLSIFIVNKNSSLKSFWRIFLVSFWNLFKVSKEILWH